MSVRFGVVGLGMGAERSKLIKATPGAELAMVCDRNEELAKKVSQTLGGVEYTTDYADLLAHKDIDCVMVMTPSGMHAEMTIQAIAAGKHVLVTKPMDVNVAACNRMIATARQHGVKMTVDYQCRYQPTNYRLHEALTQGLFGRPLFGEIRIKWFRNQGYYSRGGWRGTWRMDGGGVLVNQGAHLLDMLLWFMGPVKTVYAETGTLNHQIETEDMGLAIIEFVSGARGMALATTTAPRNQCYDLEFHGTEGGAVIRDVHCIDNKEPDLCLIDEKRRKQIEAIAVDHVPKNAIEDMTRWIEKEIPPLVTAEDGLGEVAFLQAIYQSAREGRRIVLSSR